jgi:hypothetical protein
MGRVCTLDRAMSLGKFISRLTLPVNLVEAVVVWPRGERWSCTWAHGRRRVVAEDVGFVEGVGSTLPLEEFVDARHLQCDVVDALDVIGPPLHDVSSHHLESNEAFFTAKCRDIHLFLDGIVSRGDVVVQGIAALLDAALHALTAGGNLLREPSLHKVQFLEHLAGARLGVLHGGRARSLGQVLNGSRVPESDTRLLVQCTEWD